MKPERSIFDKPDDAEEAAADADGLADIDAGRVVRHKDVAAWLETWGTSSETTIPPEWLK